MLQRTHWYIHNLKKYRYRSLSFWVWVLAILKTQITLKPILRPFLNYVHTITTVFQSCVIQGRIHTQQKLHSFTRFSCVKQAFYVCYKTYVKRILRTSHVNRPFEMYELRMLNARNTCLSVQHALNYCVLRPFYG